jgi:hypothetical protein
VQRNFECEPECLNAIATAGTVPAVGLVIRAENATGEILADATLCNDGQQFRRAVDQQSAGQEGEK